MINQATKSDISNRAISGAMFHMKQEGMNGEEIGRALFGMAFVQLAKSQGKDMALLWMSETLSSLSKSRG